jgi:hypothetical protein
MSPFCYTTLNVIGNLVVRDGPLNYRQGDLVFFLINSKHFYSKQKSNYFFSISIFHKMLPKNHANNCRGNLFIILHLAGQYICFLQNLVIKNPKNIILLQYCISVHSNFPFNLNLFDGWILNLTANVFRQLSLCMFKAYLDLIFVLCLLSNGPMMCPFEVCL